MSSFKKNTLAAALVLGMTLAGSAAAYTILTSGNAAPEKVAIEAGNTFQMTEQVQVRTDLGDNVIGRTTGLQIKVTLVGAQFAGPTPPSFTTGAAAAGFTATYAAGGTAGNNILQYRLEPTTTDASIGEGLLGAFSAFALQAAPGNVSAIVELIDPVTGQVIVGRAGDGLAFSRNTQIVERVDGVAVNCVANANADKIDVGANTTFPSKTAFVEGPAFTIGGSDTTTANLGTVGLNVTGLALKSTDNFVSSVTGNFNGFTRVFLATDATCATTLADYTINTSKTTASLTKLYNTMGPNFGPSGGSANLCVTVDGKTQIAAQTFTVLVGLNTLSAQQCNVAPISFNGSVVKVYSFNPAGVSTAQSFLRVVNPSTTPGRVTIVAWDDNGNFRGPVTFNLGARQSRQLNSEDLENGNAAKAAGSLGDGVGKWRFDVTGEFPGMRVASLNRNTTDGTVTNLTDADGHGEQRFNEQFD